MQLDGIDKIGAESMKGGLDLNTQEMLSLYRMMLIVRYFEKKIEFGFSRGQIAGTTHLCIGQEAVAVGASAHLSNTDYVVSNHRGHGHALAKGLDSTRLMAEVMGKAMGYCGGKGGSQHVACVEKGFLGTNGITGGGIPIATGAALTIKQQGRRDVSVCFFGDGASNQGTFHESLNMASLWKLPVLFVCENNLYGMSTPIEKSVSGGDVLKRAQAYDIEAASVDGMDLLSVYHQAGKLIDKIRDGEGPAFLECKTYRYCGHSKSDPRQYRSREEEKAWRERCPIKGLARDIVDRGLADAAALDLQKKLAREEVEQCYQEALDACMPEPGVALEGIFCGQ